MDPEQASPSVFKQLCSCRGRYWPRPQAFFSRSISTADRSRHGFLPRELLESILYVQCADVPEQQEQHIPLTISLQSFRRIPKAVHFQDNTVGIFKFPKGCATPDLKSLDSVGNFCQALYLDMMVVRDEGMCGYLRFGH